jgi:chitin synthase
MSFINQRMSVYSAASGTGPRPTNSSAQVSTSTLLNALHTSFVNGQSYPLEASTSLVVNTWVNARNFVDGRIGGTVDLQLGRKAWEHARRRAEDGCIILGSLHESTPSLFAPFISGLPLQVPASFYTALEAIKPFTHCVTPKNPSYPRHSSLAAVFTINLQGNLVGAEIKLPTTGIDTRQGLLHVPAERGFRAFDVFYYLRSGSASRQEREFLDLQDPSHYSLLNKSDTYQPPAYLPDADDAAAAEDFRANLKAIGIKGDKLQNVISALTGLLKLGDTLGYLLDEEALQSICEDCGALLDIEPEILSRQCSAVDREVAIAGIYEAVVDLVIAHANATIKEDIRSGRAAFSSSGSDLDLPGVLTPDSQEDGDIVNITVVEIPSASLGKAVALRTVFDDTDGINSEMKEDGVIVTRAGSSVLDTMKDAVQNCEADMNIDGPALRQRQSELEKREVVLEKIALEITEENNFIKDILMPTPGDGVVLGKHGRFDLPIVVGSSRVWFHLALHPTDASPSSLTSDISSSWSAAAVSRQLRDWRLPEWSNRRNRHLDFTADFDYNEFFDRYRPLGCLEGKDGVQNWILERGWTNGDVILGNTRIWMRENAWWEAETQIDLKAQEFASNNMLGNMVGAAGLESGYSAQSPGMGSGFFPPMAEVTPTGSRDHILQRQQSSATMGARSALGARSVAPTAAPSVPQAPGDYGLGSKGDGSKGITYYDEETGGNVVVTEQPTTFGRKCWVALVWFLTGWIPSPLLKFVGRMKRPDVRMAWREKVVLVLLIILMNATVVFYIIVFGKLICPKWDKAWDNKEVGYHTGDNDWWVSHHGLVYDLSKFWKTQHSIPTLRTTREMMEPFAGTNVDGLIIPPLWKACPWLVTDYILQLQPNTTVENPSAMHVSGNRTNTPTSALEDWNWYANTFLPKMREFRKGDLVWDKKKIKNEGENLNHMWFTMGDNVYDLTDYFHTLDANNNFENYRFLDRKLEEIVQSNAGNDITDKFRSELDADAQMHNMQCLDNVFFVGKTDFRKSARCQVNNYLLLAFTIIVCTVVLVKFLAALQLGSKRRPANQDKFVICQVPAYTEGEDQLRKGLDSLTALQYDNKRKLICVICDGMIVGHGNDRPTPKIVLDILGVDPKVDPPALPFRSVGVGSEQLNYGKVYSGLYEFEGNVVPYIVVVKMGKESEQVKAKPGNRGKRDSQVLLMSFLNRVHYRAAMNPLELEMFHQINNIIGVDPELYEYLLMVDADTTVAPDALNRLISSCANDSKIAGICGETSLENEERSWWTMIQVYEYYISHHLSKAFESLFGSVTCLPGCFCMYRLRTADKGKPLIISDKVIREYADGNVDTLHKKNLLSLGEDRYLTTLMTKHFPSMSYKFVPDAFAQTAAPETWSILLSQRRRWINSTIHNLAELVFLKDLCGFCCFSMRFVVFIDLFGTIILPATCTYLVYLIYMVASKTGQFPMFSLIIIAAVYGLQAIIFIIKRQWQHVGWMIIYILAFPIYSFVLPMYSFWKQDDFSWGNTRMVISENKGKQVAQIEDEGFDPRSIPLQKWDDYAGANGLPGRRGGALNSEKGGHSAYEDDGYEMNDMHSIYSSIKPASTIMSNMPHFQHMPPQSPGPYQGMQQRSSHYSNFSRYQDNPDPRLSSADNLSTYNAQPQSPYGQHRPSMAFQSSDNLMSASSPILNRGRSPLGFSASRPGSTVNFQNMMTGPSDSQIVEVVQACLREADLDRVTKKQLVALAEQRLQTQLSGERKVFLSQVIDLELANS